MNKKELEYEATKYDVDIRGMKWCDALSAVKKAKEAKKKNFSEPVLSNDIDGNKASEESEVMQLRKRLRELEIKQNEIDVKYNGKAPGRAPTRKELFENDVLIAPYIPANGQHIANYEWEEEIGYDIDYEEAEITLEQFAMMRQDEIGQNYKVRGKKQNKVMAKTMGPVENAGVVFNPKEDLCVCAWMPEKGRAYIYSHDCYFDVIDLISQPRGGIYYAKFKKQLIEQEFYIGGHICIPREFVHSIFDYIEKEERRRLQEGYVDEPF